MKSFPVRKKCHVKTQTHRENTMKTVEIEFNGYRYKSRNSNSDKHPPQKLGR